MKPGITIPVLYSVRVMLPDGFSGAEIGSTLSLSQAIEWARLRNRKDGASVGVWSSKTKRFVFTVGKHAVRQAGGGA